MTEPLRSADLSGVSGVSGASVVISAQATAPTRSIQHDLPDDGIPVLTDMVAPKTVPGAVPAAAATFTSTATAQIDITQRLPAVSRAGPAADHAAAAVSTGTAAEDDERMDALSLRIQSRVLAGLIGRIDPIVERCLRESLTGLLEQVLAGMTAELKVTAQVIVHDAVAQAVAAELAELHK